MNEQILKAIMHRLHDINCDINAIMDLMGAPMDKEKDKDPNEHKWMLELLELLDRIAKAESEAYGKCYLKLDD